MAEEQAQIPPVQLVEELTRREQQLEQMRQAYIELHQRQIANDGNLQRIMKNITHLPTFTGTGEVTINSLMSSVEYLLSTIRDEETRREATTAVYYRIIQGEAKNVIINIPQPDDWNQIKKALKLRYKPDTEPHEIYRKICNLRINSVSELAIETQNIKYKADEIKVYYRGDAGIDLSNVDSLLVNTVKEIIQGTLLDKIYEEHDLHTIIEIMMRRRDEDSCIRTEFKKFKRMEGQFKPNRGYYENKNFNKRTGYVDQNSGQLRQNHNFFSREANQGQVKQNPQYPRQGQEYGFRENISAQRRPNPKHFSQEGQYQNNSGQFSRLQQVGNPRPNSGQNRWNQLRQDRGEIIVLL